MGLFIATIPLLSSYNGLTTSGRSKSPCPLPFALSPEPYPLESFNGEKQRLDQIRAAYYRVKITIITGNVYCVTRFAVISAPLW